MYLCILKMRWFILTKKNIILTIFPLKFYIISKFTNYNLYINRVCDKLSYLYTKREKGKIEG